jgi:hypothetical protein
MRGYPASERRKVLLHFDKLHERFHTVRIGEGFLELEVMREFDMRE